MSKKQQVMEIPPRSVLLVNICSTGCIKQITNYSRKSTASMLPVPPLLHNYNNNNDNKDVAPLIEKKPKKNEGSEKKEEKNKGREIEERKTRAKRINGHLWAPCIIICRVRWVVRRHMVQKRQRCMVDLATLLPDNTTVLSLTKRTLMVAASYGPF
ncbi:hypothetical protein DVH24_014322 [Malus domestica]|uniref:Uncharacterized protein n=1 Tax=Malus domestica TaxID=3750 RepID=A0A498JF50_MALDO|nr:hypothetical protein DVH24_014322 [Malus domestica]